MSLNAKDFIGECTAILSDIVHRPSATELQIMNNGANRGRMLIKCEELEETNKVVRGWVTGNDLPKNCFYSISHILFVFLSFKRMIFHSQ